MKVVEHITKGELFQIGEAIGEAFVTNELFHEFGDLQERKSIVMKYMHAYVQCTYESGCLYQSEDGKAFIGLAYSDQKNILPKLKMLWKVLRAIPFSKAKRFMNHIGEIADGNKEYTKDLYLEVLMVCVLPGFQGQGRTRELFQFAKDMAMKRNVPVLFDTDMENYAKIYQHYGCELYHTKTASNGVTRYNLIWKPSFASESVDRSGKE
ncbi:N-acetyltransferase [Anaerosporobacter faecicola]|uniref:GNAT family N-acetyltransferase n=1 Tax=Anaerosporobacter faecicola TaxID=2718714 RepID=UPI0014394047|nr:GNAT family N-acetyltransferase [Anaerosporobacter faecicola]